LQKVSITVRYFGILHDIVGKRSETEKVEEDDTVMNLIKIISSRHGKRFQDFVFDGRGKIRPGLAFAVNGISIEKSKLSKILCKDVSEFVILPPISGGLLEHFD